MHKGLPINGRTEWWTYPSTDKAVTKILSETACPISFKIKILNSESSKLCKIVAKIAIEKTTTNSFMKIKRKNIYFYKWPLINPWLTILKSLNEIVLILTSQKSVEWSNGEYGKTWENLFDFWPQCFLK